MPYEIKKVSDGFKVCKKTDMKECYSKRGLPYNNALGQMRAIIISEKGLYDPNYKKNHLRKLLRKLVRRKLVRKNLLRRNHLKKYPRKINKLII